MDNLEQGAIESAEQHSKDAAAKALSVLMAHYPAESISAALATMQHRIDARVLISEIDSMRNQLSLAIMATPPADVYAKLYRFDAVRLQALLAQIADFIQPEPVAHTDNFNEWLEQTYGPVEGN